MCKFKHHVFSQMATLFLYPFFGIWVHSYPKIASVHKLPRTVQNCPCPSLPHPPTQNFALLPKNDHGPDFVYWIFLITIDSRKCFNKETLSKFTFQQDIGQGLDLSQSHTYRDRFGYVWGKFIDGPFSCRRATLQTDCLFA